MVKSKLDGLTPRILSARLPVNFKTYMDFATFIIIVGGAFLGAVFNFFFFRAIIRSAMKQVFIDLQSANAAIRVVTVEAPTPLQHGANAIAQQGDSTISQAPIQNPRPPIRTATTLVTRGGKVFQRDTQNP